MHVYGVRDVHVPSMRQSNVIAACLFGGVLRNCSDKKNYRESRPTLRVISHGTLEGRTQNMQMLWSADMTCTQTVACRLAHAWCIGP